jgi:glycerophosphoryl diester phosphodiesterase
MKRLLSSLTAPARDLSFALLPHAPRSLATLGPLPPVIGHRGCAARAPENTLGGFLAAAAAGHPVELDVTLSQDGELVVIHDDTLDRTTPDVGPVAARPWAALARLPNAKGWGPPWETERLQRLDDVLEAIGGRVIVDIELKPPPQRGDPRPLATRLAAVVRRLGLSERVFVCSFSPYVLGALREVAPELRRGQLFGTLEGAGLPLHERLALRGHWLSHQSQPDLLIAEHSLVRPAELRRWKGAGYAVLAWTVNEPARGRQLLNMGVDAIITDDPDLMRAALAEPAP